MQRKDEIRRLLEMPPEAVIEKAGHRLVVCDDLDQLHDKMARDIYEEIARNNREKKQTTLILPVGPTAQYPILVAMLTENHVPLESCWFFFMDEYCDDEGKAVSTTHPLSFKKIAYELLLDVLIANNKLNPEQIIFPDESNYHTIPSMIQQAGGIDTCYGGIGIHGHVAFNEPEAGVKDLPARKVRLNDFTMTINAARAQVGGNLEAFPRFAYTLGMREILQAKQIRLYCRNGISLDWANTVLRLALFGEPGDDYPVTHIRDKDHVIVTDFDTLQSPTYLL